MMKSVVIAGTFLLVLGFTFCDDNKDPIKKCHVFAGEDANSNLKKAVDEYKSCYDASFANFKHLVATNTCTDIKQINECNNKIIKRIEDCNSADESFFPKHVFNLITYYADHICSNAATFKFPILLEHQICCPSLSRGIDCFNKFNFFNISSNLTKEEMCDDEREVRDCWMEYINSTCPTDSFLQNLVTATFNFDQPPCRSSSEEIICNIFLAIAVVFTMLRFL